ncbi:MAG: hypothetical protein DDT31_01399 [Syntrophomonadaceae bacterium]|nr:hypothetical protein [Bacillota bacterium]
MMMIKTPNVFPLMAGGTHIYVITGLWGIDKEFIYFDLATATWTRLLTRQEDIAFHLTASPDYWYNIFYRRFFDNKSFVGGLHSMIVVESGNSFYIVSPSLGGATIDENYFLFPQMTGYPEVFPDSIWKSNSLLGTYKQLENASTVTLSKGSDYTPSSGNQFGPYGETLYGLAKYQVSGAINKTMKECVHKKFKRMAGISNPYRLSVNLFPPNEYPDNRPDRHLLPNRYWMSEEDDMYLYYSRLAWGALGIQGYMITFEEPGLSFEEQYAKGFWLYSSTRIIWYPYTTSSVLFPVGTYVRYYNGIPPDPSNFDLTVAYIGQYEDNVGGSFTDPHIWRSRHAT